MATAPQMFPASPPIMAKARFGARVGAYLIDGVVLFVLWMAIGLIGKPFPSWVQAILGWVLIFSPLAYFGWAWSTKGWWPGQTVGMKALGLKVVKTDGQPLSLGTGILRTLALGLASIPLYLGLLWAAWDPNQQGWHDKMVGTYVVKS